MSTEIMYGNSIEDILSEIRSALFSRDAKEVKTQPGITLLEYLDSSQWTFCPICLNDLGTDWQSHLLLLPHPQIYKLIELQTPASESTCTSCELSFELPRNMYLLHKFAYCKEKSKKNLKEILSQIKMDSLMEELQDDPMHKMLKCLLDNKKSTISAEEFCPN